MRAYNSKKSNATKGKKNANPHKRGTSNIDLQPERKK